jgi:hypothetical protein
VASADDALATLVGNGRGRGGSAATDGKAIWTIMLPNVSADPSSLCRGVLGIPWIADLGDPSPSTR